MNKYHQEILSQIERLSSKEKVNLHPDNYSGSNHVDYHLKTSVSRKIAKDFIKAHGDISITEFEALLGSLYEGNSIDEKMMAGKLLGYLPRLREKIDSMLLNNWSGQLVGWSEVDSLCQSNFIDQDLLSNWEKWKNLLNNLAKSSNLSKKRASLVLLTGPVRQNEDARLSDIAFQNIDSLKSEKDILITKAISWLLRDLIKHHRSEVKKYLLNNSETLPKIAVRETQRKLLTGKK